MASTFNTKGVHQDGKARLKIGLDENSKLIEGLDDQLIIKNRDGSSAKIAKENIIGMPENVSETNKLVTQEDLKKMVDDIQNILESANNLAKIVGVRVE